ncbi:MAG: NAD(+) diphosphatase [Desulfococcaceae bacterium]
MILRGDQILVGENGSTPRLPDRSPDGGFVPIPLGRLNGADCRAASLPDDVSPPAGHRWLRLRELLNLLPEAEFRAAGYALHLFQWDRSHQFCPGCGHRLSPMVLTLRTKTCPGCGTVHHPRIAPAVIVSVRRDDKILLARSARYGQQPIYSVIAGYVEVGETLAEAVRREIREEVALQVRKIRYFDSQPWPFSGSLMTAFTARYESGEIAADGREILDAGWFSPDDLPRLPPPGSVSRKLIDNFLSTFR